MILASASTPEFFEPAVIGAYDGLNVYISGDNVAKSPALFAYLKTKRRFDGFSYPEGIRVISIGSVKEEPEDTFYTDYSLLKWS